MTDHRSIFSPGWTGLSLADPTAAEVFRCPECGLPPEIITDTPDGAALPVTVRCCGAQVSSWVPTGAGDETSPGPAAEGVLELCQWWLERATP
jgi:hypothetical protein